jgi:hypothetical protein
MGEPHELLISRQRVRSDAPVAVVRLAGRTARAAYRLATDAAPVLLAGWGAVALLGAPATDRPRVAAIGMLVTVLPPLLQRAGRGLWPVWLLAGGTAAGVLALLDPSSRRYWVAVPIAVVHALWLGLVALYLGVFDAYASSNRESWRALTAGAIPALLSALAGVVLAVVAAAAAVTGR